MINIKNIPSKYYIRIAMILLIIINIFFIYLWNKSNNEVKLLKQAAQTEKKIDAIEKDIPSITKRDDSNKNIEKEINAINNSINKLNKKLDNINKEEIKNDIKKSNIYDIANQFKLYGYSSAVISK